jgi:hypothetical protein
VLENGAGYRRRLLLMTDATGYGGRDDRQQSAMQADLMDVLDWSAKKTRLDRHTWERQPQGDGELAVLPNGDVEPLLVDDFIRQLTYALDDRNQGRLPQARLRLRVAIHHGVAIPDANGFSGQGAVVVGRLLNSPPLRAALELTGADLALIVSDPVFTDTIAQRHTTLRAPDFREVDVRVKEYQAHAWIYVPYHDLRAVDLSGGAPEGDAVPAAPAPATSAPAAPTAAPTETEAGAAPSPAGPVPTVKNVFRDINAPNSRFNFGVDNGR